MADLHLGFLLAMAIIVGGFIVGNVFVIVYLLAGCCLAGVIVAVRARRRRL